MKSVQAAIEFKIQCRSGQLLIGLGGMDPLPHLHACIVVSPFPVHGPLIISNTSLIATCVPTTLSKQQHVWACSEHQRHIYDARQPKQRMEDKCCGYNWLRALKVAMFEYHPPYDRDRQNEDGIGGGVPEHFVRVPTYIIFIFLNGRGGPMKVDAMVIKDNVPTEEEVEGDVDKYVSDAGQPQARGL
jgi:hypothetical protein